MKHHDDAVRVEAARSLAHDWLRLATDQSDIQLPLVDLVRVAVDRGGNCPTLVEAAIDLLEALGPGRCANCHEILMGTHASPGHATGPQATKATCAMNPYGNYMATTMSRVAPPTAPRGPVHFLTANGRACGTPAHVAMSATNDLRLVDCSLCMTAAQDQVL